MVRCSRRAFIARSSSAVVVPALGGCVSEGTPGSPPDMRRLSVGSKNFVENRILGFMTYEAVNRVLDRQPVHEIGYGQTSDIWTALVDGSVDTYWEYTGTLWHVHPPVHDRTDRIDDPDVLYERVRTEMADHNDLRCFSPASFDNPYVFVARPKWVEETGVTDHSALVEYVSDGATVPTAVGPSFYQRRDGWPGFLDHYEVEASVRDRWDPHVEVVNLVLAYEFLVTERIDVAMGFGTDPQISQYDLHVFDDDRDFFPLYSPLPVVHRTVVERVDGLDDVLDRLGPAIESVEEMRALNARVVVEGERPRDVALSVLRTEGIVP
ncbi:glycine betaine ABC transporter substrate-binding protein [Haloarchaeobius sp. DFWS5]|uniref:ABC transporter substrate-binding protein n=1 Tax=Haloarchaeobius sp. DFWS5 TaxID=3446114 RepID=UPI003EB7EAAD